MSIEHHAILMIQFLKPVMIVMIPSRVQQWSSFSTFFSNFARFCPQGWVKTDMPVGLSWLPHW